MLLSKLLLVKFIPVFVCNVFLLNSIQIQENLPVPLDPALVFPSSDLVQVVETLPLYVAGQNQVSFYDYPTKVWHTYPYPKFPLLPGEFAAASFAENPDGSYALKVDYFIPCDDCDNGEGAIYLTPSRAAFVRERWHFDPKTGAFTPFEAICGDHARAKPGEGEWVVISSGGRSYLCNTDTGQTSTALPNIGSISTPSLLRYPSLSPDGRWLVFTFDFTFDYASSVWAYDFVEDKLSSLGKLTTTSSFTSIDFPHFTWIDDQHIGVENFTVNYGHDDFYLYGADVSQTDSLKLFYHADQFIPLDLDQPSCRNWLDKQFDSTLNTAITSLPEACTLQDDKSYLRNGVASPDGRFRLVARSNGTLSIRNVETREITIIAQTPEGKIDGVWGDDGFITVIVWGDDNNNRWRGRWRVRVNI